MDVVHSRYTSRDHLTVGATNKDDNSPVFDDHSGFAKEIYDLLPHG